MAERMGISGWSGVFGTWVSILGAFGGGFAALNTYSEEVSRMEDARVVQTFALFEMSNRTELLQSRQRILDAANNATPFEGSDLWLTLDFYDALQICVDRNLCDQDLAVRLFQPYAVPIWNGLSAAILAGRTPSDPNMGGGLQWIANLPAPTAATDAPTEPETETPALDTPLESSEPTPVSDEDADEAPVE